MVFKWVIYVNKRSVVRLDTSSNGHITLQDAFLKKKAKFIEASARRTAEATENAKKSKRGKHSDQQGHMMKTLVSWKKRRSSGVKGMLSKKYAHFSYSINGLFLLLIWCHILFQKAVGRMQLLQNGRILPTLQV